MEILYAHNIYRKKSELLLKNWSSSNFYTGDSVTNRDQKALKRKCTTTILLFTFSLIEKTMISC